MTTAILLGTLVFAACVLVQLGAAVALVLFLHRRQRLKKFNENLWVAAVALSGGMLIVFLGHLLQVGLWAWLFVALEEFESYQTAFYHSMVNFSSLGYGDIVMSEQARLLGAMEATSGILMFGISTGIGLAVFTALLKQTDRSADPTTPDE